MTLRLDVDDARLSDLSLGGWLGLGAVPVGLGAMVHSIGQWALTGADPAAGILVGGLVAIIGAAFAHDNATPETMADCENCGRRVRIHASRDTADEVVLVQMSGRPRRATVGPLSVVVQTRKREYWYCSDECAVEHTRPVMSTERNQATAATSEVGQRAD